MLRHVNLIPASPCAGLQRSSPQAIEAFAHILEQKGIPVTVRRSLGAEIQAACGQLKGKTPTYRQGA
jgi:23S rRNA (adenine2503-C2)-methyltransferase